jgi:hypothetical protein
MTTEAPARVVVDPRCSRCGKKLADYLAVPFRIICLRRSRGETCNTINECVS